METQTTTPENLWIDAATGLPCFVQHHETEPYWYGAVAVRIHHPLFGNFLGTAKADGLVRWLSVEVTALGPKPRPAMPASRQKHLPAGWWIRFMTTAGDAAAIAERLARDLADMGKQSEILRTVHATREEAR